MASAAEVENFLTGKYKLEKYRELGYRGLWNLSSGRSQQVVMQIDERFLVVSSPFAKADDLPLPAAMKAAEDYVFGIKNDEGYYVVRHVIPLADIDESEVEWAVDVVAAVADAIEQNSVGGDSL